MGNKYYNMIAPVVERDANAVVELPVHVVCDLLDYSWLPDDDRAKIAEYVVKRCKENRAKVEAET